MSEFQPFDMERWMSRYEQGVEYNLSESGVHPMTLGELVMSVPDAWQRLASIELNYPHVNGIPELRQNIANLYDGASIDNVLVTVGAAEANYIATRTLLSPGEEILVMMPNYMQIWGIAKNHGYHVKSFHLLEEEGWAVDQAEIKEAVTSRTKMIAVCNPNNPTGRVLSEPEIAYIVTQAASVGAWILADEVYSGAERQTNERTPSFFGRYDRILATGSMSKAYGMPGLRIGWVVGPPPIINDIWARHEYTTISASMLSNELAAIALSPAVRPKILRRTRHYIRQGYPILEAWLDDHPDLFRLQPPDAAAIAFIGYALEINSSVFADRLQREKKTLIVPGDHFGMDHYLRISFGLPSDYLLPALERIHQLVLELT